MTLASLRMCRGMSEGTAVAVPSRPTTYTRESRSHEGSAWPLQGGVHALHTVFLFRLSPKVDKNPGYTAKTSVVLFMGLRLETSDRPPMQTRHMGPSAANTV